MPHPFHLAINVTDLDAARAFYGGLLGAVEGRSTATWVDFDLFGHQLSLHLGTPFATEATGRVGDHLVPMPHFGVVLPLDEWHAVAARLSSGAVDFVIPPSVRFEGEPGEQWTMFFHDPAGNPLELKGFAESSGLFAT
ncbi:VOC family protein [Roseovarius sp. D22-M7]|uniref:VOC family protein n=1 Tax=Roseovarius sp. D22-M7 TaxID=3127116 RepID=UPI00300FA537